MRRFLIILFLTHKLTGFSQEKLTLFEGNFDQAIDSAQKVDKDIFLITKGLCPAFENFTARLTNDSESVEFLNKNFIVYEYNMDNSSEIEKKRMKKYYHSWRGFPQLYFIDKNENLISDISYPLSIEQKKQLEIWKNYKTIESDWTNIKRVKSNNNIDYNSLIEFLTYRQIKYSSFDLIQISNVLDKYFKSIDSAEYYSKRNWFLIQQYVTISSNPKIFDLVAKHKNEFQISHGDSIISDYLLGNYQQFISWRKPEKVNKMAKKYPYNSVPEAIQAIEIYRSNKELQTMFKQEWQIE